MSWYENNWHYAPSKPRAVKGGIKSQTTTGEIGSQWWSKRWIDALTSMGRSNYGYESNRLARGRTYARKGQVIGIKIEKGSVTAKVQGTRRTPYDVAIKIKPISDSTWHKIANCLSEKIYYAAQLIAGEMPKDMETVFNEAGTCLFPKTAGQLETDCSCPDWSNPCKHIAAVFYLVAEEFDRDPFLMFTMRGMDKGSLMALIDRETGGAPGKAPAASRTMADSPDRKGEGPAGPTASEPLASDAETFWKGAAPSVQPVSSEGPDDGDAAKPHCTVPPLKRLGNFPFWRGTEPFNKSMEALLT